jgi:hypothetical protein
MEGSAVEFAAPRRRGELSESLEGLLHRFVEELPLALRESILWVQASLKQEPGGLLPDSVGREIAELRAAAREPVNAEDARRAFQRFDDPEDLPPQEGWVVSREGQLPYKGLDVQGKRDVLAESGPRLFQTGDPWEHCQFVYVPHPDAARWTGALEAAGMFLMCSDWTEVKDVLRPAAEDRVAAMVDTILLAVMRDNAAERRHSEEVEKQATTLIDELHNAQSSIRRLRRILRSPTSSAGDAYEGVSPLIPSQPDEFFRRWTFRHKWVDANEILAHPDDYRNQVACILLCFDGEKLPREKAPWDRDEPMKLLRNRWDSLRNAFCKLHPYFEDVILGEKLDDTDQAIAVFKWLRAIFKEPFDPPPGGGLTAGLLAHWAAERGCPELRLRPLCTSPWNHVGYRRTLPVYTINGLEGIYTDCKIAPQLSVISGEGPVRVDVRFPSCPEGLVGFVQNFRPGQETGDYSSKSLRDALEVFYRWEILVAPRAEGTDIVIEL